MLNYTALFTPHHIATLADWLQEKSEVFLQIELPHSGGSGRYQTVRSLAEIKRTVEQVSNPEIEIFIWKNNTLAEFEAGVPFPDDVGWIYMHSDEVMYFAVKKNRNSSASYIKDPSRYTREIEQWIE